jgi:hypothetical protein
MAATVADWLARPLREVVDFLAGQNCGEGQYPDSFHLLPHDGVFRLEVAHGACEVGVPHPRGLASLKQLYFRAATL